jgi:hypothetical protein
MRSTHVVGLLGLALLIGGCEMQPKPIITRRFLEARFVRSRTAGEHAILTAFVTDVPAQAAPPPPPATPPKAEEPKDGKPKEPAAEEAAPAPAPATPAFGAPIDRTLINRRLVFSVAKADSVDSPAARLDLLTLTVDLLPEQAGSVAFESWDRFATDHDFVELGGLSAKQTRNFTGTLSAGPAVGETLPVSGSTSYTANNELNEDLKLKQRFVKLTGALQPGGARLYQEGALGIDLVGTTLVDVQLRFEADEDIVDAYKFHGLFKEGKAIAPKDATFSLARLTIPAAGALQSMEKRGVVARIGGSYRIRLVAGGAGTIMEGDDFADYVRGSFARAPGPTGGEIVILRPRDLKRLRHRYDIHDAGDRLTVQLDGSAMPVLMFESMEDAEGWLAWIRRAASATATTIQVGPYSLIFGGGKAVTGADLAGLQVHLQS